MRNAAGRVRGLVASGSLRVWRLEGRNPQVPPSDLTRTNQQPSAECDPASLCHRVLALEPVRLRHKEVCVGGTADSGDAWGLPPLSCPLHGHYTTQNLRGCTVVNAWVKDGRGTSVPSYHAEEPSLKCAGEGVAQGHPSRLTVVQHIMATPSHWGIAVNRPTFTPWAESRWCTVQRTG